MKIISKIIKKNGWYWECKDWSVVTLSTWLTDNDIKISYCGYNRSPANIRKVKENNKCIAFWHRLWNYNIDNNTTVVW